MKYILDTKEIKDGFLVYDNYNNKCFTIEKTHLLFSDTIKLKNINGSILFKLKKHKVNHHEIFEIFRANESYGYISETLISSTKSKFNLIYHLGEITANGEFSSPDYLILKNNDFAIGKVYSENNSIIVESDKFKELSLILILIFIIYIKYNN